MQKDFRGNFCEEDDSTTEYRDAIETLAGIQLVNATNLAVVCLKQQKYKEAIICCDEALQTDHKSAKAIFLKAKVFTEMQDYSKAIELLKELLEKEPDNKDATALLQRVTGLKKQYDDKSTALAKKMFKQ